MGTSSRTLKFLKLGVGGVFELAAIAWSSCKTGLTKIEGASNIIIVFVSIEIIEMASVR